ATALALGHTGLGLCDRNSFAGVVRGHTALRDLREEPEFSERANAFRYLVGVRLGFADGTPDIIAYPTDRDAYGRLCALLTAGNLRAKKADCILHFNDLTGATDPASPTAPEDFTQGQLFILKANEEDWEKSEATLRRLKALAPGRTWLAACCTHKGRDRERLQRLADLARRTGVPLLASNEVLYHAPERRMLQDVVTCIREHLTIFEAGRRLEQHAERHMKPAAEMARLFREHPEALAATEELVSRIGFSLDQLAYSYPEETIGSGETAQETLRRLTWAGARKRYPEGVPYMVKRGVLKELRLIAEKQYAPYF